MAITYRDIKLVAFPVYALPSGNWYGQDGLLFLDDKILDDKNMKGELLEMDLNTGLSQITSDKSTKKVKMRFSPKKADKNE